MTKSSPTAEQACAHFGVGIAQDLGLRLPEGLGLFPGQGEDVGVGLGELAASITLPTSCKMPATKADSMRAGLARRSLASFSAAWPRPGHDATQRQD